MLDGGFRKAGGSELGGGNLSTVGCSSTGREEDLQARRLPLWVITGETNTRN